MPQASLRDVTPISPISKNLRGRSDREAGDMQTHIRQRAYELYEARGRQDGHQMEDWIQAEQEIRSKYRLGKVA